MELPAIVTLVALFIVFFGGVVSYLGLPGAEDPGFTIRTAVVTTAFPGAGPNRVEDLVTSPIEEVIQQIPEVETIRSSSATGLSIVYVDVADSVTELRPVWDELRRRVDDVKGSLPGEARPPSVNDSFGDVYGTLVAVIGEGIEGGLNPITAPALIVVGALMARALRGVDWTDLTEAAPAFFTALMMPSPALMARSASSSWARGQPK